jgi:hypothetical protein
MKTSNKTLMALASVLIAGSLASGCSNQATELCEVRCACEHCGDDAEKIACAQTSWERDVASSYGCDSEWSTWAGCVLGQGVCIEASASYTTLELGSCSVPTPVGLPCDTSSECSNSFGSLAFCDSGQCNLMTCEVSGITCTTDLDCSSGDDKCEALRQTLLRCQADASVTNPFLPAPDDD